MIAFLKSVKFGGWILQIVLMVLISTGTSLLVVGCGSYKALVKETAIEKDPDKNLTAAANLARCVRLFNDPEAPSQLKALCSELVKSAKLENDFKILDLIWTKCNALKGEERVKCFSHFDRLRKY